MERDTCLHILADTATTPSRVWKEATSFLRNGLARRVVLMAKWEPGLAEREELAPGISVWRVRLTTRILPRRLPWQILKEIEWRHRVIKHSHQLRPMMIFCHSVMPLRTAVQTKRVTGAPLVYDAHELETERADLTGNKRRVFSYWERRLIRHCDAVICVSDSIADWYQRRYGLSRPLVVRNVPDRRMLSDFAQTNLLRQRLSLGNEDLIFLYQGALTQGRRVEEMVRVFANARRQKHLVFMGAGPLEGVVTRAASLNSNVHFLPQVPQVDLLNYTAGADVGFAAHLEPTCLNHRYALPNKFFEYVLAGLPTWVNDVHEEMAALVRRYGFGWVTAYDEKSMVDWVNLLDRQELNAKRRQAIEASKLFSWAAEEDLLLRKCRTLLA